MLNICICFVGQVAFFILYRTSTCLFRDKTATYKYCVLSCAWRVLCTYLYLLIYISIEIYLSEIEGLRFRSQTSEPGHLISCLGTWSTFINKFSAIVGIIGRIFEKVLPDIFGPWPSLDPSTRVSSELEKAFKSSNRRWGNSWYTH